MDLEQIQCVLSVARLKSFTEASYDISLTQSSISKKIAKLETELNSQLFIRAPKEVSLTPAGQIFVKYGAQILDLHDKIRKELAENLVQKELLTIGSVYFSQSHSLAPQIGSFFKRHPEISLAMVDGTTESLVNGVLNKTIDVAFVVSAYRCDTVEPLPNFENDRRFISYSIAKDPYYLVVSDRHPLAKAKMVDYQDLKNEKIITIDKRVGVYHTAFDTIFEVEGLSGNIKFQSSSIRDALLLVSRNMGVALFSSKVTSDCSDITLVPMKKPMIRDTQIIILNQKEIPQNVRAFFAYFKKLRFSSHEHGCNRISDKAED